MAIRVLIAAEPPLARELARALPQPEFSIEGALSRPEELLAGCRERRPQLVLLQLGLAQNHNLVCVQEVMAFAPTPILMVAGPGEDPAQSFSALASGALDAVRFDGEVESGRELAQRARLLAGVRVITHVRARRERDRNKEREPAGSRLIAIGASLGGPRALAQLLHDLKPPLPAPLLIVQHISEGFSEGLAHWLGQETRVPVIEAEHDMKLEPGLIAIAPSGRHLEVRDGKAVLTRDPPVGGFRPSVSALFRSVARAYGQRGIGVVLTGMGSDGADGLLAMRRQGARTLAQDEATCAVWGMPKAAWELGAVETLLPLDQIAAALRRLLEG